MRTKKENRIIVINHETGRIHARTKSSTKAVLILLKHKLMGEDTRFIYESYTRVI